jgi:hypothetical protein
MSSQASAEAIRQMRLQFTVEALQAPIERAQEFYAQAFVDREVIAGRKYTYRLIQKGTNRELASIELVAGKTLPVPAPDFETPIQLGQRMAGLHFKTSASIKEQDFGMLKYEVLREDSRGAKVLASDVALAYTKLGANEETAGIVSFTDPEAPASGAVQYSVRAIDIFGVRGVPAAQTLVMKDLASPRQVGLVAARRTSAPSGLQHSVRVFWVRPTLDTDERPVTIADLGMSVSRRDEEKNLTAAMPTPVVAPETILTLDVIAELIPSAESMLQGMATQAATQKLQGSGAAVTSADIQSEREKIGSMTLAELTTSRPGYREEILGSVAATDIYTVADQNPPPDTHVTYAVIPGLRSTGFSASETRSSRLGIPAKVLPTAPTMGTFVDAAVQSTGSVVVPGASMTNVVRMQPNVGMRAGIQGRRTPDFAPGMSPAQAASARVGAMRAQNFAALPKSSANSLSGSGGRHATVSDILAQAGGQAGPPKATAAQNSIGVARKFNPVAPMNYGRRVTVRWNATPCSSPLSYRVYRAVGTGFVKPADAGAKPGSSANNAVAAPSGSLMSRANKVNVLPASGAATAKKPGAAAATLAQNKSFSPREALATKREGITRIGGKERLFFGNVVPARSEFVLLGETKPGELQFFDLTPLGQSATYYYFVEPVNRWGQQGASAVPKSIKVLPSALPSNPTILGASTANEALTASAPLATTPVIRIKIAANLEEEMVTKYEVYRTEIAVAPPVVPAANATTTSTGLPVAAQDLTAARRDVRDFGMGELVILPSATPVLNTLIRLHDRVRQQSLGASALSPADLSSLRTVQATSTIKTPTFTLVQSYSVKPTDGSEIEILDSTVSGGKAYLYYVKAVSAANLSSGASSSLDAIAALPEAVPPTLLASSFDEDNGVVMITLGIPAPSTRAFSVRRSVEGGELTPMGVIQRAGTGPQMAYQDESVIGGRSYVYEIRSIDQSGSTSRQPLVVTINPAP